MTPPACEKVGVMLSKVYYPPLPPKSTLVAWVPTATSQSSRESVFQSGFVWRIVNNKWPQFEEVFWGFDIERLLMMPDDMLERKASDPGIIRNFSKVKTILENAVMIADTERREEKIMVSSSPLAG